MKFLQKLAIPLSGLALLGFQTAAHAGMGSFTIVYAPIPASVPTLSEWGMVALIFLMAVISYRSLREKMGGKSLASIFLTGMLLLGAVSGDKLITQAYAALGFSNPQGGTLSNISSPSTITNITTVPLKLISVTPFMCTIAPAATCRTGSVVPPQASCTIACNLG